MQEKSAKKLKRTEGATRQKAFSIGVFTGCARLDEKVDFAARVQRGKMCFHSTICRRHYQSGMLTEL